MREALKHSMKSTADLNSWANNLCLKMIILITLVSLSLHLALPQDQLLEASLRQVMYLGHRKQSKNR